MTEPKKPDSPKQPCGACRGREFWLRPPMMLLGQFYSPPEWLCCRCHPNPTGNEVKTISIEPKTAVDY